MNIKEKEPLRESFQNGLEMRKCGEKWADVLGLADWAITYVLVDEESEGLELGHNDYDFDSKTSVITIYKQPRNEHFIMFQEETLIHELLHCKFPIEYEDESYESKVCADLQHQVLNDTARALFMTKYGLDMIEYKSLIRKRIDLL